jgi:RNA polymerase sigma-70 factor (ECF subfamily)
MDDLEGAFERPVWRERRSSSRSWRRCSGHETMRAHLPPHRSEWSAAEPTSDEKRLLDSLIDAHERCDAKAVLAAAATDLRVTMPPYPWRYDGLVAVRPLLERGFGSEREGDWRLLPTSTNRMPAAAEITTFGPALFEELRLPALLGA